MKKILVIVLCLMVVFAGAFAKDVEQSGYMSVDFCWYPGVSHAQIPNNFSVIDFNNWGIEGRITPWYQVKVATPLGEHWLVNSSNVKFKTGIEVTPVTVMPKTQLTWEILPFLLFNTGFNIGTGWDAGFFQGGMAAWNGDVDKKVTITDSAGNTYEQVYLKYDALTPFKNLYIEPWAELQVQMDFSVFAPQEIKDWTHIVFQAAYKLKYTTITGTKDGQIWRWQLTRDKFTGWQQNVNALIGYQMPRIPLNTIGLQFEFDQYFDQSAFHGDNEWKTDYGDFATCPIFTLAPIMLFKINDHHSIALQFRFKTTRLFGTYNTNPTGQLIGTAWYFDRIAMSYTWNF